MMPITRLESLGEAMKAHQPAIGKVQWAMVAVYLILLLGPLLPPFDAAASLVARLGHLAEILFWGLWWPAVILATLFLGQVWCGVFCPDGTLTEAVSRRGRGGKPPAWIRWPWWPTALYAVLTLFADLTHAHHSALGTLIAVGSTTLLALLFGSLLGRGKRVWCRYLCPVAGIFSLLARGSALHFKVDRAQWDSGQRNRAEAVDCPVLLDVRRLTSNEKCNMCGRCSGHRGAVTLAARPPGQEIVDLPDPEARLQEAIGIVFVLIGLSFAGHYWAQDGVLAVLAVTFATGVALSLLLLAGAVGRLGLAVKLAYGLIPLGGFGLFLIGTEHSFALLAAAGIDGHAALPWLRGGALLVGAVWSAGLGLGLTRRLPPSRRVAARAAFMLALALLGGGYFAAPATF